MCQCMKDTLSLVTAHINRNLPENAVIESLDTEIMHRYFRLDGSTNSVPAAMISGSYKVKKENGSEAKNRKKVAMPVFGRFCPFCGEEHKTPESDQKLWAVHIKGPDSIVAATSRAEADFRAAEINTLQKEYLQGIPEDQKHNAPNVEAVVVEWGFSRKQHAESAPNTDWSDCF